MNQKRIRFRQLDFELDKVQKNRIFDNLKKGNMAIIQVGPEEGDKNFQGTFSKNGHYLVVSDIDEKENLM